MLFGVLIGLIAGIVLMWPGDPRFIGVREAERIALSRARQSCRDSYVPVDPKICARFSIGPRVESDAGWNITISGVDPRYRWYSMINRLGDIHIESFDDPRFQNEPGLDGHEEERARAALEAMSDPPLPKARSESPRPPR